MIPVRRAYEDCSGLQLHYRHCGQRRERILVLLHQAPSSSLMFEPLMRELGDSYYLLAPDFPGFGNSDPLSGTLTIDGVATLFAQWLQQLGVPSCWLFGHHSGAAVALQLASDGAVDIDGLMLSGPPLLDRATREQLPALAVLPPAREDGEHLLAVWQRLRGKEEGVGFTLSQREMCLALGLGDRYQAIYQAVADYAFGEKLAALALPVLLCAGTRDSLYTSLEAAAAIAKQPEVEAIQGAGTYVCERNTAELAALLTAYINRHGQANDQCH